MNKVSIIIPVYNVEKYITKTIESVINQTYSDIEVILIDDGSEDSSGSICDEYAKNDYRIKVFHQENLGVSQARNKGIDISTGDYILFIDSDDYVSNDYIEALINSAIKTNADVCCCGYTCITKEDRYEHNDYPECLEATREVFLNCLFSGTGGTVCSKLYRSEIIKENSIEFNPIFTFCEDQLFALEVYCNSNKFSSVDKFGYYYNRQCESLTANVNYDKWYKQFSLIELINEIMLSKNISDGVINKCVSEKAKNVLFGLMLEALKKGKQGIKSLLNDNKFKKYIKAIKIDDKFSAIYILPLKLRSVFLIKIIYHHLERK